ISPKTPSRQLVRYRFPVSLSPTKIPKLPARLEFKPPPKNRRLLPPTTPVKRMKYKPKIVSYGLSFLTATAALIVAGGPLQAQDKKPNIIFIMGDDIGWSNIGVYNQGIMSGRTPNLDRLAA